MKKSYPKDSWCLSAESSECFTLSSAGVNTTSLVDEMRKLQLTNLDESGKEALVDAKKRFVDARRKATEAFNNEALTLSVRIRAMAVTILEKVENPASALAVCRSGLEELHSTPFVRENLKLELTGGIKAMFKTEKRRQIICSVCQINRIIYDVSVIVGQKQMLFLLPCIEIGNEIKSTRCVTQELQKRCINEIWATVLGHGYLATRETAQITNKCCKK